MGRHGRSRRRAVDAGQMQLNGTETASGTASSTTGATKTGGGKRGGNGRKVKGKTARPPSASKLPPSGLPEGEVTVSFILYVRDGRVLGWNEPLC